MNGLGSSATAFSSKHMLVRSYRDGYKYEIEIVEGEVVGVLKRFIKYSNETPSLKAYFSLLAIKDFPTPSVPK